MAVTAREVVFFIRAENQASRAFRQVARDMGGLRNLKNVQDAAAKSAIASGRKMEGISQQIRRNEEAINRALAQQNRWRRAVKAGGARGFTKAESIRMRDAAVSSVKTLRIQEALLAKDLGEARLAAAAQAAEFDRLAKAIPLERLGRMATLAQRVGKVMQVTGVIIGATFAFAAAKAAKFQSQLTLAATQARPAGAGAGATLGIAAKLNDIVLKQMQKFPAASDEMADSLYQIFSGTVIQNEAKAGKLLETFNKMAVAGGVSLAAMTQAGISIFNNFPGEFRNMTQAANVFFAAVRYGRMNAQQFADSLGFLAPIAREAGLSFRSIAEDMAFFTKQTGGKMTRQDAQGLARLIQLLSRDDVSRGLAKQGVAVFDATTGKMRAIVDILTEIHEKLQLTPQETINFFKSISASGSGKGGTQGTIQAIRIFAQGVENAEAYRNVVNSVRQDQGQFVKDYEAMAKSPDVAWKTFRNNVQALFITLGTQAIPAFVTLGGAITPVLKWFNDLSPSTKHAVAQFAVFGSIATVLLGTLLAIAGAAAHVVIAFKLMKLSGGFLSKGGAAKAGGAAVQWAAVGGGGAKLATLGKEAGSVSAKFGAIGAAIAVLAITLPILANHVDKLSLVFGQLGHVFAILNLALVIKLFTMLVPRILAVTAATGFAAAAMTSLATASLAVQAGIAVAGYALYKFIQFADKLTGSHLDKTMRRFGGAVHDLFYGADKPTAQENLLGNGDITQQIIKRIERMYAMGQNERISNDVIKKRLEAYFPELSQGAIDVFVNLAEKHFKEAMSRSIWNPTNRAANFIGGAAKTTKVLTDADFMKQLRHVASLQATYNKTHGLKDYITFQKALTAINSKFSDANYQGYVSEYLSRVEAADKKSNAKRLSEAEKAERKRLKAAENAAKAYAKQLSNAYSNVASTYDRFLQQNQINFGSLFSGPFMQSPAQQAKLGFNFQTASGGDLLTDLKSQLFQFNVFNRQISKITGRGGPKSLTDQLRSAGPGALPNIKEINKMSGPQFREYVSTWNRSQKAIKTATMDQLKTQLDTYRKFGSKVALAIIAGIRSEDKNLQNELERMVRKMFPNLVAAAAKAPKTVARGSKQNFAPSVVHNNHHNTVVVHNPKTESIEVSTKKAIFHMKTKKH